MKLMQFDRGELNKNSLTNGYLLDYTDDWTLIQFVESDIYFNGYLIIRNDTIKRYREFYDNNSMVHRALRKLGFIPKVPEGIDLKDVNSIVLSVNSIFPLLVIHRGLVPGKVSFPRFHFNREIFEPDHPAHGVHYRT